MISLWESDGEIRVDLEAPGGERDVLVLAVRWRLVGVLGGRAIVRDGLWETSESRRTTRSSD